MVEFYSVAGCVCCSYCVMTLWENGSLRLFELRFACSWFLDWELAVFGSGLRLRVFGFWFAFRVSGLGNFEFGCLGFGLAFVG